LLEENFSLASHVARH